VELHHAWGTLENASLRSLAELRPPHAPSVTLNSTIPATQAAVLAEFNEELALSLLSLAFFRCVARGPMPIRMRRGLPYPSGMLPSTGRDSRQCELGCS
jgi:hypothetical protein